MRLTLEIIESYNFEKKVSKPDWDDVQHEYTLPNGISLTTLTVCFNEACESDSLEGLDGFIYIETKEELDVLVAKTYDEVLEGIAESNKDFDIEEYI